MSVSERTGANIIGITLERSFTMQILKVEVKKHEPTGFQIRLTGRDDAGNILTSVVVAPTAGSIPSVVQDATKSMQALGANFTEEETAKAKPPK